MTILLLAVVAAGVGGWYKGWIRVPAWLRGSRNRMKHARLNNDGDGGALFYPDVAGMPLDTLSMGSTRPEQQ